MRVGGDVARAVDRTGGNAPGCEARGGLGLREGRGPGFDRRPDHVLHVIRPALAARESRVARPLGVTDGIGEGGEVGLAHDLDREPAVACAKGVEDADALGRAGGIDAEARGMDDVGDGDHRVVHRDVDVAAATGAVALAQSGEHADGGMEAGGRIAEGAGGGGAGRPAFFACVFVEAGHALDDRRVGGTVPVGARRIVRVAEAGDRDVDERGVMGRERGVADPEPIGRTRTEVLGHHVEAGREREEERPAFVVLQIDRDALLGEVVAQEGRARAPAVAVVDRRAPVSAGLAFERLDLHDGRAHQRHELRGVRQRMHLLGREDRDAGERADHVAASGIAPASRSAPMRTSL